jgi:nitroimidazol reductase NimA-like FMN-containing flavoprotein (pyridoxamine 5'-phosphate oxidase superfamily)
MGEPITTLDPRFSDADAPATTWPQTRQLLDAAQLFWISTIRSDGRPHVSPLVAVWYDDALYFATGATEQKAVNIRSTPNVVLTTGCSQWDRGIDVVVEGTAVQVEDDRLLMRLAEAWTEKWDGRWRYQVHGGRFDHDAGAALVFRVAPTKVLAFGKGTFTHTRHEFR